MLINHFLILKNSSKKFFFTGASSIIEAVFSTLKAVAPILPFGLTAVAGSSFALVDEDFEPQENPPCVF